MFSTEHLFEQLCNMNTGSKYKYNGELNKSGGQSATTGSYMFINSPPLFATNVKNKWTGMAGGRAGGSG